MLPFLVLLFKWLHGTVLRCVADEINSVNAKIVDFADDAAPLGCKLLQHICGCHRLPLFILEIFKLAMTLNTLEQLAKERYQHISALPMLIKFLNLTKDQNYLVNRIQGIFLFLILTK